MKLVEQRRKHDAENNSSFFCLSPSPLLLRDFLQKYTTSLPYTPFDPLPQKINYEEFFSLQDKTKTFTFTCVMKLTHFSQASSWEARIRMGSLINREVACFALKRGVPDDTMVRVRILAKTHCQALIEQALWKGYY